MCDYSLYGIPNRLAAEGEQLVVHRFPTRSIGLACSADLQAREDRSERKPVGLWSALRSLFSSGVEREAHEMNWVDAAKGKTEASCPFEYAARLTEVMLLGIVALRAGHKIAYDGANMRVTNASANGQDPNDFLRREPRQGWSL